MLSNCDAEIIKFPSRYLSILVSALNTLECSRSHLPVRLLRALDSYRAAFWPAHAQTIGSRFRSGDSPYAIFQGEDAYMPARNVSSDIRHAGARYARA